MTTKEHLLGDGADNQELIKQIDKSIAELRRQRDELVRRAHEAFVARAKEQVGQCFKVNGVYAKITGMPRHDGVWNEFPAILLAPDPYLFESTLVPFHEDDIQLPAEPVDNEEFEREFRRVLDIFRQQIGV